MVATPSFGRIFLLRAATYLQTVPDGSVSAPDRGLQNLERARECP